MKAKQVNMVIDILMTVMMSLLMAYSLIGEAFHEIAGTLIFILFIVHHYMHRNWFKVLRKGKYNQYRIFTTVLNLILLILMIIQPVSGILMSKHLFTFLSASSGLAGMRAIHLCLAYWCYALMSIHLGLHIDAMTRGLKSSGIRTEYKVILTAASVIISIYGVVAFIRRQFPEYMFLRTEFAFFDFDEMRIIFFADYIAIMVLFATIEHYIGKGLKN